MVLVVVLICVINRRDELARLQSEQQARDAQRDAHLATHTDVEPVTAAGASELLTTAPLSINTASSTSPHGNSGGNLPVTEMTRASSTPTAAATAPVSGIRPRYDYQQMPDRMVVCVRVRNIVPSSLQVTEQGDVVSFPSAWVLLLCRLRLFA